MNELLMAQLDKDQPSWWIEWATQSDLQDIALAGEATRQRVNGKVRQRIAIRLFHRILNAALSAGLIEEAGSAKQAAENESRFPHGKNEMGS